MAKDGAVFTKRWIVDLMLDVAGYTADRDLAHALAIEPSCGEGAFLLPMVERLIDSAHARNIPDSELANSIRAYELSPASVSLSRDRTRALLLDKGLPSEYATSLSSSWIQCCDYILDMQDCKVDYVIGNPPYIRSNDIPKDAKEAYLKTCSTMTPGADLFVGFFEKGLSSLGEDGVLALICADRWMHNSYGKKLRQFVSDSYSVDTIITMHDVDAFDADVSAYPAITFMRRGTQAEVNYIKAEGLFSENDSFCLREWLNRKTISVPHCEYSRMATWFSGKELWPLASPEQLELINYLESRFPPLEDAETETKVGIGVATGRDDVYITTDSTAAEPDRLVPVVTSKQLSCCNSKKSPLWLVNPWDDSGHLVDLDGYPKLKNYFFAHFDILNKRQVARRGDTAAWYRTIDKVHPGLAGKGKLLIQDMHARFEPHYDDSHYPHGNLYYVTSGKWNLEVLGGLLMSDICESFIDAYGVKMRGGTLRFQAQYLRKIRVPVLGSIDQKTEDDLRDAFLRKDYRLASDAANRAYGLNGVSHG